ncbi:MAG: GAF domain-containing protein [Oxalobacteraceae bacterium]|nr:MAG: GAF domain-containing protein [Oxalobacteraceae bacterium]
MLDQIEADAHPNDHVSAIHQILEEVAAVTSMGFVAVACVTENRWIACQVLDQIDFGMSPGDELHVSTTICNDIRESGNAVVIDNVAGNPKWQTHPAPALYGFKSYVSMPIVLSDGSFYGTLCAVDPNPRKLTGSDIVPALERFASRVAAILSKRLLQGSSG